MDGEIRLELTAAPGNFNPVEIAGARACMPGVGFLSLPLMERHSRSAYLFIAFPIAILVVFTLVPTVAGLGLSLFTWDGAGEPKFVGLGNFTALAQDDAFWPALRNTMLFVVATVPISVGAAFGLAVIASAP